MINEESTRPDAGLVNVLAALHRIRSLLVPEVFRVVLHTELTLAQFHALQAVWRREPISGRQLARELGVSPAAVVALADRLVEQGYLERVRDRDDRRIWWLRLTPSGRGVFEQVTAVPRS